MPRGVVAAANRYCSSVIPLAEMLGAVRTDEDRRKIVEVTQGVHEKIFYAFIAGQKWKPEKEPEGSVEYCGCDECRNARAKRAPG